MGTCPPTLSFSPGTSSSSRRHSSDSVPPVHPNYVLSAMTPTARITVRPGKANLAVYLVLSAVIIATLATQVAHAQSTNAPPGTPSTPADSSTPPTSQPAPTQT